MAYTEFHGPHSTSAGDDVWHTRPTMFGSGNLTANRDGSTINLHLYAEKSTLSGSTTSLCTSCRIVASNGWASDYYELTYGYDDPDGYIEIDTSCVSNDALTFFVHYYCCESGDPTEPECDSADGDQSDITMDGSVSVSSYTPWSDPTPGRNLKCSPTSVKPDTSVTLTWTAGVAGTGNSIGKYSISYNRYRNGSWSGRTTLNNNITGTTYTYNLNNLSLRPGDIIKFDVDTYINSSTTGHTSGWWYNNDTQNTGNISVYKDGIIYYKDLSGVSHECTMRLWKRCKWY